MSLTIDDLFTPLTADQITPTLYTILQSLGFSVTSWRPGGAARTIVALFARTSARFTTVMSFIAKSGFLDWATGPYLEVLAKQVYNVDKIKASFAGGFVTLTNSGGGVYPFTANQLTLSASATGKSYRNDAPFTLNALTSIDVAVTAIEVGAASTATATQIDTLGSPLIGVTCSNAAAVVGFDAETDENLRSRCRAKLGSLSPNGPAKAFDFVLRTPALNPTSKPITRTQVIEDSDHGVVTIYAAYASGHISGGDVTISQASAEQWATPLCIEPTVLSATDTVLNVSYSVWYYASSNLDTVSAALKVQAALVAFFSAAPIGGFKIPPGGGMIYEEALELLIGSTVAGLGQGTPIKVDVTSPGDTAIADGIVPVFGTPTPTFVPVVGP